MGPKKHKRETNRLGIFIGFGSFFVMEKTLRVLGSDEEGSGHSHSHSHSHSQTATSEENDSDSQATGVHVSPSANGLKARTPKSNGDLSTNDEKSSDSTTSTATPVQSSKLSAYLNLFGDFVHNMCVDLSSLIVPYPRGIKTSLGVPGLPYPSIWFLPSLLASTPY